MDTGNPRTTGDELRALPGYLLRDGQTLTVDDVTRGLASAYQLTFEFDLGYTLVTPSGANIATGTDSFTVDPDGAAGAAPPRSRLFRAGRYPQQSSRGISNPYPGGAGGQQPAIGTGRRYVQP